MKKLQFKPQFTPAILNGTKTATIRSSGHNKPHEKEVFAAVSAMLQKADDGFALLRCTKRKYCFFGDVTDDMLQKTNADRDWYKKHSGIVDDSQVVYIEWELVEARS